jgi:hypothetical protein
MVWADFGKPNQRERLPSKRDQEEYASNDGLYTSGYRLISTQPIPAAAPTGTSRTWSAPRDFPQPNYSERLWKGWVLPASDSDIWLASGSAAYFDDLDSKDVHNALAARWAEYRALSMVSDPTPEQRFELETQKGALFLDQLRSNMGDDRFFKLMADFFAAHKTQAVAAQTFLDAAGVSFALPADQGGALYVASDIRKRLSSAILVYGTRADAGANRYAAEELQKHCFRWLETAVPIRKDFEVSDEELRTRDVIFVGRPESNSALAAWQEKIGLQSSGGLFRIAGQDHASETEALVFAAANPLDQHHMVLVLAGNSALQTVLSAKANWDETQYSILDSGRQVAAGFLK